MKNLEIINITSKDGKVVAILSFQDPAKIGDLNNGYDTIEVPVNIREIQLSARGNMLVNQSVKQESISLNEI
jgi:hypothetical protein